jgi:hypothetical protein
MDYSTHARQRMKERSITENEVEQCIEGSPINYKDKKGNPIYRSIVNGRGVKVVCALDDPDFVITVADYEVHYED